MVPRDIPAKTGVACPVIHNSAGTFAKCPFGGTRIGGAEATGSTLEDWYPNRLRTEVLGRPSPLSNPYGSDFDYKEAFSKIDYAQLKADLHKWMRTSQSWWPADYGHYGPQMIRTAWHGAGTYRISDGRGGAGHSLQRFLPINSWLDNGNTDKTRRLLWPVKQKYGDALSWADLLVLAGNVAFEDMGVKLLGFSGGRVDAWEDDNETNWGSETTYLGRDRWAGTPEANYYDLENPQANAEQALIYVNPEGPGGNPDPVGSAKEVRITFSRMAMSDEETVALIAGGHTFGKSHGAVSKEYVGPAPAETSIEHMGLGWINSAGTGNGKFTITNGIEGSWVQHPIQWDKEYLINLLDLEWERGQSPAGANQWTPKVRREDLTTPDAHVSGAKHPLMMMTSDIALKTDPEFNKCLRKFRDSPLEVFTEAFAKAWFKLTHRDMGPKSRYVGPEVPREDFIWQDPLPVVDHTLVNSEDVAELKHQIIHTSGLEPALFAKAAWASASTHRVSDKRGGANGARIQLQPQKEWEVNQPEALSKVLESLESIRNAFNKAQSDDKRISLADIIVLAGTAAVEVAAKKAGVDVEVPFVPGRTDALQEDTDVETFEWLHPVMDGFRNFEADNIPTKVPAEAFLIDRAKLLGLTTPQLVALIGGMRVMGLNWDDSSLGVFTHNKGALTNDFFVNLLTMDTEWTPIDDAKTRFEGRDRETGSLLWKATRVDLILGHDTQLRAVCEVYGGKGGQQRFANDFVKAWHHVMMLDRFDLQ